MILYEQGIPYWNEMRKFNASKAVPGMVLHSVEKMSGLLDVTTSPAVKNRIHGFLARHSLR